MDLFIPILGALAFLFFSWQLRRHFDAERLGADESLEHHRIVHILRRRARLLRVELAHAGRRAERRRLELVRRQAADVRRKARLQTAATCTCAHKGGSSYCPVHAAKAEA